jgi:DNA-binding transcriptional ArsR family regulator
VFSGLSGLALTLDAQLIAKFLGLLEKHSLWSGPPSLLNQMVDKSADRSITDNHMVEQNSQVLNRVFHALADPTRREILRRLAQHDYTVTQLAEPFDMSLAAVSKHIKVLESASLIKQTPDGRRRRCRFNPAPLQEAGALIAYLEQFWSQPIEALDHYLQGTEKRSAKRGRRVAIHHLRDRDRHRPTPALHLRPGHPWLSWADLPGGSHAAHRYGALAPSTKGPAKLDGSSRHGPFTPFPS